MKEIKKYFGALCTYIRKIGGNMFVSREGKEGKRVYREGDGILYKGAIYTLYEKKIERVDGRGSDMTLLYTKVSGKEVLVVVNGELLSPFRSSGR